MHIVHTVKFAIGVVCVLAGLGLLFRERSRRGFGQKRQLGALLIVVGAVFIAIGLGVDIKGMIGL